MRQFSDKEKEKLELVNPRLVSVVNEAAKEIDIFVVCGHRDQHDQDLAFAQGFSKVKFPNSKHNKSNYPNAKSDAVDLCPYPIDWNDHNKFYAIYRAMMNASQKLGIKVRAGADFNQDGNLTNDKFIDLPHFELVD